MKYEGVNFNSEWVAQQSFKDFAEHEKHHGLTDKQMKEVHKLCIEKHKPAKVKDEKPDE